MEAQHTPENALNKTSDLERTWSLTQSEKSNNIYKQYIKNPKKNKQYKIIDMGVYCIANDITPDMLRMGVRHIKEVAALLQDKESKDHNKVVIMSEEDYKKYEMFKKMLAYQETQNK